MPLFTNVDRRTAAGINEVVYCNPFLPERVAAERQTLGEAFVDLGEVWNITATSADGARPNLVQLERLGETLLTRATDRLRSGVLASTDDALLYEGVAMYVLYYRCQQPLRELARSGQTRRGGGGRSVAKLHATLADDLDALFDFPPVALPGVQKPEAGHLLACFFQIARAFEQIFTSIVGTSLPAARLRGSIWQSIFTHDMHRYRRLLYDRTGDYSTLITGPSGTGKELVARAIAGARYVPFDANRGTFANADVARHFFPLNLSALSPTLIESELFGHRRGAFTGAVEDRQGWLQTCPPLGTVFLDEIGELDPSIQVKLLRVLQSRTFERLGDTESIPFRGKIVAATHRDLHADARSGTGHFRRDLYYRLNADVILTPTLAEQIAAGGEGELRLLVSSIAARLLPTADAEQVTRDTMLSIERHLGPDYAWPGNFRELEQCVRNVLVHGEYRPPVSTGSETDVRPRWLIDAEAGRLTAEQLVDAYCTHVYRLEGTYERAGERIGLDRRTVRAGVARAAGDAN